MVGDGSTVALDAQVNIEQRTVPTRDAVSPLYTFEEWMRRVKPAEPCRIEEKLNGLWLLSDPGNLRGYVDGWLFYTENNGSARHLALVSDVGVQAPIHDIRAHVFQIANKSVYPITHGYKRYEEILDDYATRVDHVRKVTTGIKDIRYALVSAHRSSNNSWQVDGGVSGSQPVFLIAPGGEATPLYQDAIKESVHTVPFHQDNIPPGSRIVLLSHGVQSHRKELIDSILQGKPPISPTGAFGPGPMIPDDRTVAVLRLD